MNSASSQRITLIITAALGLLTLAYAFFVFLPGQKRIAEKRQILAQRQDYIVQSVETERAVTETRLKLKQAQAYVAKWQSAAPEDNDVGALFGTLNRFARQTHVKVTRFEPQQSQPMETIGQVRIAVGLEGSFSQIHDLFRQLESLESPVWVEEMSIQEVQGGRGATACEVTLAVFTDRSRISD